jgi:hypothetical protein
MEEAERQGMRRIYLFLFAIQIICLGIVAGCAWWLTR